MSGRREANEFQSRKGISEIKVKLRGVAVGVKAGAERVFNRGNGISEIEGKAARVAMSEGGSRTSLQSRKGISEIEGKAARVAMSEGGSRASSIELRDQRDRR